ncbi:hypothetical protein, partial [Mycolicibacterium pulveris]
EPVGGWPDEAHGPAETSPGSAADVRSPDAGVTGPSPLRGIAGEAYAALADMSDEERAALARQEGQANLRERQSAKDNAAWGADNKRRKAAGEQGTNITHTREQVARDMRLQRGTQRRSGNQARYEAEQEAALPPHRFID